MAILAVHHWLDKKVGLREIRRVTRGGMILLTVDPSRRPWLTDHVPELAVLDEAQRPAMSHYGRWLGPVRVAPLPVAHDCSDGFLQAYRRTPEACLDARIRSGGSSFRTVGDIEPGLLGLRRDLDASEWARRHPEPLARARTTRGIGSSRYTDRRWTYRLVTREITMFDMGLAEYR